MNKNKKPDHLQNIKNLFFNYLNMFFQISRKSIKFLLRLLKINVLFLVKIIIWVIGVYSGIYGLSVQNYENAKNNYNNRLSMIANISKRQLKYDLLINLQSEKIVIKPEYINPIATIKSFFGLKEMNTDIINNSQILILNESDSLTGVKLSNINISNSSFYSANFNSTDLNNCNAINTKIKCSNLDNSIFINTTIP